MTQNFSTLTEFIERRNYMPDGYWGVALDVGYSAVKGMSPNMAYIFPSYARPTNGVSIDMGDPSNDEIMFRDSDGQMWEVGASAQRRVKSNDTNDSTQSLFGRNRYYSPMFRVLALTGIGVGMLPNEHGKPNGKKLVIQTGLPPAYLADDVFYIKDALKGNHKFSIKVGKRDWESFDITLTEEDIKVMAQPMGSLISASMSTEAKYTADAKKYFGSRLLVFDGGFGTLDLFPVICRQIETSETNSNLGMKAVFTDVMDTFRTKYKTPIAINAMQKYLTDGYVPVFDRAKRSTSNIDIAPILEESNKKICEKALNTVEDIFNYLLDFDYLLVTGGTGAAWYDMICDRYKGMVNLKIISGSQNDTLSSVYSNVRGYYLYQANKFREMAKLSKKG